MWCKIYNAVGEYLPTSCCHSKLYRCDASP